MSADQIRVIVISASVAAAVLLLLSFAICASYATYRMIFMRKRRDYDPIYGLDKPKYAPYLPAIKEKVEDISAEDCEIVRIASRDGLSLAARYYHRQDGAPIHVIFHGYKSSPLRDGCGGGCDSRGMGHNLLMPYQRAHGESEGRTISFGALEQYDVADWCRYLADRFGEDAEIILTGASMGAASVIMAAGIGLPGCVKGVIADCPFSTAKDVLLYQARQMGYPSALVYPFARLGARLFGRFSIASASATEAARRADVPMLIIHSECDTTVPAEMSRRIYAAATEAGADCTLKIFPTAEHCMSYFTDHEGYARARDEFIKACTRQAEPQARISE